MFIPDHVNASILAWKRAPLRPFFSSSGQERCLVLESRKRFLEFYDNHHSLERYTGHITRCINDRKVLNYKTEAHRSRVDAKNKGNICNGYKD